MKKLFIFLFVLTVFLGAGVLYVSKNIDGFLRHELSAQLSATAGTRVRISNISTDIFAGTVTVNDFSVANPSGFPDGTMLSISTLRLRIEPLSLLGSPITINEVLIDQPVINAVVNERGEVNVEVIADRLAAQSNTNQQTQKDDRSTQTVLVEVDQFVIGNASLSVDLSAFSQPVETLELPTLSIEPIGHPNGVPADQIGLLIVESLLDDAKRQAKEAARKAAQKEIRDAIEEQARDALDELSDAFDDLFK
ncbi:MAG: hypothetical protein HWD83_04405 [Gammaproteobacteria bacterium]|nr:hypothetical protein [Gammaproteobacteria bacterium]